MQVVSGALERYVSAVRDFSSSWLPIQAHTTDYVIERFKTNIYSNTRAPLAKDIRQDPSLYLFCLKELSVRMPSAEHTPMELFFRAPIEWIYDIVRSAPVVSSIDTITDFQAARLKESMVAAVTSELLCPALTIDPELGYTCSLMRQLGINLSAWIYPDEYKRAVSKVCSEFTLDEALREGLGFSPSAIGATYARDWRLCTEIQDALSTKESAAAFACSQRLVQHENPATKLRKICQIGESLAQAMQPTLYNSDSSRFEDAQVELIRHLGSGAIKKISETARGRLMHYRSYDLHMPTVASGEELRKSVAASLHADQWKKQNGYLSKLCEEEKSRLEEFYKKLNPHDISRDAIRLLIQDVIPSFGFAAGYVYLYSPKQKSLTTTLTIGNPSSNSPQKISPNLAIHQKLLVTSAYSLKSALRANIILDGTPATAFAARLGSRTPIGVLYLESTAKELSVSRTDVLIRFQALQHSLAAALCAE